MKFLSSIKKYKIFLSFLISYLLFMIIPILIESSVFVRVLNYVKNDSVNSSLIMLKQSKEIVDTRLREVQSAVQVLALDTDVVKLLGGQNDVLINRNLSKELGNYKINNSFIKTCIIYFKNSNLVISPGAATNRDYLFFESSSEAIGKDFNSWYGDLWSKSYDGIFNMFFLDLPSEGVSGTKGSLVYMQTLPFGAPYKPQGILMVVINQEELRKLLEGITKSGGWAFIANDKGDIVASLNNSEAEIDFTKYYQTLNNHKEMNLSEDEYIVSYTKSTYNGWSFVLANPTNIVMKKANNINRMFLQLMFAMIVIGLFSSYLMATRNSRPLSRLLEDVKKNLNMDAHNKRNVFEFIEGSVSELLQNNYELKNQIQQKMPILQSGFIDRLLRGSFISAKELNTAMMNIGLDISDRRYLVILLRVDFYDNQYTDINYSEMNMAKTIVSGVISNILESGALIHEVSEDIIAVLLTFDKEAERYVISDEVNKVALKAKTLLKANNNIEVSFAAGQIYCLLTDIYKSFDEAVETLNYSSDEFCDTVRWYCKPLNVNNHYYYPIEVENKIINLAKTGENSELQIILENIFEENFIRRKIHGNVIILLMWEIKGTINKLLSQIKDEEQLLSTFVCEKLEVMDRTSNSQEIWDCIKGIYSFICSSTNRQKNKSINLVVQGVMEFLKKSYTDQQVDRAMVASKFNISEAYLSRIFKEEVGECFSQYLENIRIQKAKELIAEKNISINEISARVGYTSPHAFRRAYKRVIGSLPSKDRE